MNVRSVRKQPLNRPIRPNPADTISTGQELGADDTQKDLFAVSAGIAQIQTAPANAEFGKSWGEGSWHQGALAMASALAGGPALASAVVSAVREARPDQPVLVAMLSVATAYEGAEALPDILALTSGLGETSKEQGLFAIAASVAGVRGADEAIEVGLSEGNGSTEQAYYAAATAAAGGSRALGPILNIAEDFASTPELRGPYALAAGLSGKDSATGVLRMAEALGQTSREKAAFSLAGSLLGVERTPGFIRMARAMAENEAQIPAMTIAAALTGAPTSARVATAIAGAVLFQEPSQ